MPYVNTRTAVKTLSLCPNTLRKYADDGRINTIRDAANRRRYDIETYLKLNRPTELLGYARVSSAKQKDDLVRQVAYIHSIYPNIEIIKDVGSGLNFKRKGFKTLLGRILSGDKLQVVVTHKDRLARFGTDIVKHLLELNNGELLVLNQDIGKSPEAELVTDMLAILHHFSCRIHGRRSHKCQENKTLPFCESESKVEELARSLKIRLQQDSRALRTAG